MYQQHAVDRLAILINDNHISETSVGCILTDLFQRVPLQAFSVIHSTFSVACDKHYRIATVGLEKAFERLSQGFTCRL